MSHLWYNLGLRVINFLWSLRLINRLFLEKLPLNLKFQV